MPKFVVLRHDSPRGLHWDFMLEVGEVLKTWALPQPPESAPEQVVEALPDHRLHYLNYEGPVSGGRGAVSRWVAGSYRLVQQTADQWQVSLEGSTLTGLLRLTRLPDQPDRWQFSFIRP